MEVCECRERPGPRHDVQGLSPGDGSLFRARKDTVALPGLPCGHGETVLVVDDEPSVLAVTGQTLEAFGYRALTACHGEEALAIYTSIAVKSPLFC